MRAVLERAKIAATGARGYHIFAQLSQEGFLCFAAHRAKQPTFALLDEWLPSSPILERDEALAHLASRYFRGHGPATERDLAWWSGLTLGDVRTSIALAESSLAEETVRGVRYFFSRDSSSTVTSARGIYLLPGFNELILGYTERSATLDPAHAGLVVPGSNGVFKPTILSNGRVIGTWKAALTRGAVVVTPMPFATFTRVEARALPAAVRRYERFVADSG